jgi:hypothetical protein
MGMYIRTGMAIRRYTVLETMITTGEGDSWRWRVGTQIVGTPGASFYYTI